MHFHWGGDLIFRDTRLPNKRFVIGTPETPVATDIREWLANPENHVLRDVLSTIPGLPATAGQAHSTAAPCWSGTL